MTPWSPLLLPDDLPAALRESVMWRLVLDPMGVFIVAVDPIECPACHTAKCFFFLDQPRYKPIRFRCLGCTGDLDAAQLPSAADVAGRS